MDRKAKQDLSRNCSLPFKTTNIVAHFVGDYITEKEVVRISGTLKIMKMINCKTFTRIMESI